MIVTSDLHTKKDHTASPHTGVLLPVSLGEWEMESRHQSSVTTCCSLALKALRIAHLGLESSSQYKSLGFVMEE